MRKSKKFYSLPEAFEWYKKDSKKPVPSETFISITNAFMAYIFKSLLKEGIAVLPNRTGSLRITGSEVVPKIKDGKITNLPVDWKSTKELWAENEKAKESKKLVYFFNEHTNNIRYKVVWSRERVMMPNKTLYTFISTRYNKRSMAAHMKTTNKEYGIR